MRRQEVRGADLPVRKDDPGKRSGGEPVRDSAADERRGNARTEARRAGHAQAGRERAALESGRDRDPGTRSAASRVAKEDDASEPSGMDEKPRSEPFETSAAPQAVSSRHDPGAGSPGEHRQLADVQRLLAYPAHAESASLLTIGGTPRADPAAASAECAAFVPMQATSTLAQLLDRLVHPPRATDEPWRLQLDTRHASLGVVHLEHRPDSGWRIAVQSRDPEAGGATDEQLAELGAALRERGHRISSIEPSFTEDVDP